MSSLGRFLMAMMLACAAVPASAQQGEVLNFVRFAPSGGVELPAAHGATRELGVDTRLEIKWDHDGFFNFVAESVAVGKGIESLTERLATLKTGVQVFLEGQRRQLAVKSAGIKLLHPGDAGAMAAMREDFDTANAQARSFGTDARNSLAKHKQTDPQLFNDLNATVRALQGGRPAPMAQGLAESLDEAAHDLGARLGDAQNVDVYMEARIVPRWGQARTLHLDGYDSVAEGEPKPFPRTRIAIDQRTREELLAAQEIIRFVQDFEGERFQKQLSGVTRNIRETVRNLLKELEVNVVEARLKTLVKTLRTMPAAEAGELLADARALQSLISPISESPILRAESEIVGLLGLLDLVQRFGLNLNKSIVELPERIESFIPRLSRLVAQQPALFEADLLACFERCSSRFKENILYFKFKNLGEQVAELAGSLGLTARIGESATALLPKDISLGESLDTVLDLRRIRGERHPGDRVEINVRVVRRDADPGETEILASATQRFRIEVYGFYLEPRGALLFVDPRSRVSRELNYEPALGVGFHWRYGIRNSPAWNHDLALGIGVSFSLLDFDDNDRFELGAAASVSFLKDLLWVGYGRNFQANADYFYFGVNPLALSRLWRR